jgi:hypothetical protein
VTTRKRGRVRECRIGPGDIDDVTRWVDHYRRLWESRLGRLEAVVERRKHSEEAS